MLSYTLLPIVLAAVVLAANEPVPSANADPTDPSNPRLIGKRWSSPAALPYMVDTSTSARGIQVGYNICNSTTEGPTSMCQTMYINDITDFCLWIPPTVLDIGDAEAGMVASCTKKGHGTRIMPAGALTGVQVLKAKSYIAIAGTIDQTLLNLPAGDQGGELDPFGADNRGNPIGATVFSNSLPSTEGTVTQGIVWTQFIGSNTFCLKACDNSSPDALGLCQHIYDTVGCNVNLPASYDAIPGVFETCESDDMADVNPTVTAIPASSNCSPVQSTAIYTDLTSASTSASSTTTSGASSSTGKSSSSSTKGSTTTSSGAGSSASASGAALPAMRVSGVNVVAAALLPVIAGLVGAAFVA